MTTMINYLKHCKTLDEIKSEYKKLTQQWLSQANRAGEPGLMTLLDKQYYEISQRPKFKEQPEEVKEEFLAFPRIVQELVRFELRLEMCGSWLWVSGNTYDYAEQLKELGLKFSSNKKMWYYRPKWSRSSNSTPVSLDFIRKKYGSDTVEKEFIFDQPPYKQVVNADKQGRRETV